jgi:hypothetical protein
MAGTTGAPDARKSVGSKDAKKAKRFRGQDLTLPDREKESKAEADAADKLRLQRREALSREISPDQKYSLETMERVIEYRREGLTTLQIGQLPGMPSRQALYNWLDDKPEFLEQFNSAYNDFVREKAEAMLHKVEEMDKVKGLRGYNMVQAMDKQVMRTLQIAGVRLRKEWGPEVETGGDTIVIEVSGGWNPAPATALPQDANGQGAEAARAADRWKGIREGAVDADSGSPAHPAEG